MKNHKSSMGQQTMLERAQKLIDDLTMELHHLPLPSGPYSRKTEVILRACRLMNAINKLDPKRPPNVCDGIIPMRLSQSAALLAARQAATSTTSEAAAIDAAAPVPAEPQIALAA